MAAFLYCIPNPNGMKPGEVTPELLHAAGIGHAFESKPLSWPHRNGPHGNGECFIIGDPKRMGDRQVGYLPDEQQWRKVPKSEAWVGFYPAKPPAPADLQRGAVVAGHKIALGPAKELWEIPAARKFSREGGQPVFARNLPQKFDVNADGEWMAEPLAQYARLGEIAEWVCASVLNALEHGGEFRSGELSLQQMASDLIAVNYRVSAVECAALNLMDDITLWQILLASIDWPAYVEMQKKTQCAG